MTVEIEEGIEVKGEKRFTYITFLSEVILEKFGVGNRTP
jgi:hypothetical protein